MEVYWFACCTVNFGVFEEAFTEAHSPVELAYGHLTRSGTNRHSGPDKQRNPDFDVEDTLPLAARM